MILSIKKVSTLILSKLSFRVANHSLIILLGLSVASCNESKEIGPEVLGYDYYPISMGQYRSYQVEEINYLISGFDTARYQLRETIFDSIQSNDQVSYLSRRDIRLSADEEWESDSVWVVAKRPTYLSISENNIAFIKLSFPPSIGKQWDGNSLNAKSEITYYYEELESSLIDSIPVSDHIRVIIEDVEENVTGIDLRSEVYVRGIGLVEKDYLTQTKCTASDCGAELGEVIAGRSLKQTLIEIGNEE